jgi:hypothetical protein
MDFLLFIFKIIALNQTVVASAISIRQLTINELLQKQLMFHQYQIRWM